MGSKKFEIFSKSLLGPKSESFLGRKSYLDMEGKFRIIEVFISNAKKYIGIPSSTIDYMYKLFRMFFFRCANKLVSYEIHPYTGCCPSFFVSPMARAPPLGVGGMMPSLNLALTGMEGSQSSSQLSGRKRPSPQREAMELVNSQLLKISCVGGDERTPRSIAITAAENHVLRLPDSGLMFKQQRGLQDMLADIYDDPNGFQDFIEDIRSEMKPSTDAVPSPFDSRCGCLNDYSIDKERVVGRGRFSVVYYTTRKRDMMPCALKKINWNAAVPDSSAGDKVSPTKCLKEVGLLRSLQHPNIVKYLDSFLHEDELYIALEWAGKGDLKGLIQDHRRRGERLSDHMVWAYFSQCCEAVRHMHEKRIIHRDIKPSNIFIMEDGRLKLGDLGLGRYLDLQSILAFSQVGTPLYMSPEVLRGEGHHFASDIWSLGCMLYELATLRSPFHEKGLTMDKLFLKIIGSEYPTLKPEEHSERVIHVIDNMLQGDPKKRPDIVWVSSSIGCGSLSIRQR